MAFNNVSIDSNDYQIKYVRTLQDGNVEYYATAEEAFHATLLKDAHVNQHFNHSLTIEIAANKSDTNYKTSGRYFKEVNNSDVNDSINNEINHDINASLPNDSTIDDDHSGLPQLHDEKSPENKVNLV